MQYSRKSQPLYDLEESINLYISGMPMLKVCKVTNIPLSTLQRHLKIRNLCRSNKENSRKYHLNHSYFKKIDCQNKAYWLGFIYADGYVTKNKNQKCVGVALSDRDEDHLEVFKKEIQATYPIGHYTTISFGVKTKYVRLLMTSDEMFNNLISLGVVPQKSLKLKFPDSKKVPRQLVSHFIRGYFDGDGSFSKCKRSIYKLRICGTKEFLTILAKHIGKENIRLYQRWKSRETNNYDLDIGGRKQVKKIGDYIYKESHTFMKRKWLRYKSL